ncbi:Os11g0312100 [Oryza sativa Japonica Group]|uniref:Os11g0312100 protein n=1 Tax=Oryza sativa subsp. japonica TaxID=39947 RepID=A0A0P0Y1L8_ORYSJ|nr:Os11g0312100 [Oryza sativa Japonica Group]
MSQGFRPRGARSFGTIRGGFAGRPGRSGAHHAGRSNLPSYGQRAMDSGTGRAEKTTTGSGSNKGGTLVSRWDKSAEGSRKVLGGKKEAWQNKAGDLGASVTGKEGRGKNVVGEVVSEGDAKDQEFDRPLFEDRNNKGEGVKGAAKKVCSKCFEKGHVADDCVVEVYCDICDSFDHVSHKCPVLKLPKPVVQAVGMVEGLGFCNIPHQPLQRSKKGTKLALVHVVAGSLSKERLVAQLQRLCPAKWKWEPVEQGKDSFVVLFPSKGELQRAINFGGAEVKEGGVVTGIRMEFREWYEKEEGYLLPKVWVKVFGLRKKLREYLTLWVVGSLLGATQMIIPRNIDVVIADHYFELRFEVEKKGFDDNGDEVEFHFEKEDGDGDDGGLDNMEDGKENGNEKEGDHMRDMNSGMILDGQDGGSKENGDKMTEQEARVEEEEEELKKMADQIIDVVVEDMLGEIYDRVAREGEEQDLGNRQGQEMGDGLQEKVVLMANVEEVIVMPVRSSKRLANGEGIQLLEKAEKRKARKNLDFCSVDNLSKLGLNLGASSDVISDSVFCLKEGELDRMGRLEENFLGDHPFTDEEECSVSGDEQEVCDNHILDHLCGKVMEEEDRACATSVIVNGRRLLVCITRPFCCSNKRLADH